MDRGSFLLLIAQSMNTIWVLTKRGIVLDCSENYLDFFELTRDEIVFRDIFNDPMEWVILNRDKVGKKKSPYFCGIKKNITGMKSLLKVVPHEFGNLRFIIFEPVTVPDYSYGFEYDYSKLEATN